MKKLSRCLLSILLCLGLLFGNMPLTANAATIDSSTQTNVDKVVSYAAQLADANGDFTTNVFTWDTQNYDKYKNTTTDCSWAYFNGVMLDAYMDLDASTYSTRVANFYNANLGGTSYTSSISTVALDSVEAIRPMFDLLPSSTGTTRTKYQNALVAMYNYVMSDISYSNCGGNLCHRLGTDGNVYSGWSNYPLALDGIYMAQPFLMECANAIDEGNLTISGVASSEIYEGVYNRLVWIYNNLYDSGTQLYYHAYNPTTGQNNGISWSRSIGWYVMALVDIIEMMPSGTYKTNLEAELPRIFDGLLKWQDSSTGMWYNVTAYTSSLSKNILETSGTSMFAYAMIKAYQNGYVTDSKYYDAGVKAFNGVVNNKMTGSAGNYAVVDTYLKSGANNYASYYTANGYTTNEAKGVGALIMTAALLQNGSSSGGSSETDPVDPDPTDPDPEETPTETTTTYQLASTITAGGECVIASGNSGSVTIIANNNGTATGVSGTASNGTLTFSSTDDESKSLWTFSSATSGTISNNGLYAALGSYSTQFSTSGLTLTISNKGSGAYQIYRTSRSGSGSVLYLNPANLTSKTTTATTVYLYEKVEVEETHTHTWDDGEITTAATCTEDGVMTYTCTSCGETKTEAAPAVGHTVVTDAAVAATCTTTGLTEGSHCSVCNTVIKAQETVPVTDHTWNAGEITTAATCTKEGVKTYTCTACGTTKTESVAMVDHIWDAGEITTAATCTEKGLETYTCTSCGTTKTEDIPATGHTVVTDAAVAATCTTTGLTEGSHCSVCNTVIKAQETVPVTDHTWNDGEITTEATATEDGVKTYTCISCGETKTEVIPATGVVEETTMEVYQPADTIIAGNEYVIASGNNGAVTIIANNNGSAAGVSGTVINSTLTFSSDEDESKSLWTFTSATSGMISNNGLYVSLGSYSAQFSTSGLTLTIANKGDGAYQIYRTSRSGSRSVLYLNPANLTSKTNTATTVYLYEKVTVGGHSWNDGVVTTAASCTQEGVMTYTCIGCGETKTEAIPATGHTAVKDAAVAATCTTTGLTEGSHCSVCGTIINSQQVVAATGHTWNSGTITKAATASEDGVKTYTCTVCGATKTETIPALGETTTVEVYKLATSITAGKSYVIASGNNGTVTIVANNNGTAAKVYGTVANGVLTFNSLTDESKSLWTFAGVSSGKIYNNGLYVKTSSTAQFNTKGETMTMKNLGNGAYQIYKKTSSGALYYLNPNLLNAKTSAATTVYLYELVTVTTTTTAN